ncbi:glycoside hydrolase family 36 protein [Halobaculum marinum]|uniref:Glycoside hydrolase family 36 protein n=2 Tax=Halobaculum marinum TaxID=3031996 RepID=A0ABD5WU47_9EURY
MTERASAGDTTVAFDPQSGDIDVVAGDTTLLSGRVSATSTDGTPLSTSVSLSAAHGAVDITVTATNDTDEQRALGDICVISDAETAFSSDDRIFEHGYQSWTPTATTPLDDPFPPESVESVPQMTDVAAPDEGRTSHAVTALSGDAGSVTLGFLDHEAYLSRFDVATAPVRLTALCPGDGVSVSPGECRTAATLRVDATRTVDAALASIADAVADRMDARVPAAAPTGWCSWYHYFTEVTADDVRDNVGALDDWGVPLDVIQIDDGYEQAFGDWRTLADGFDDMRALRDDIVDAGHTAGIWLAPFYVQADSQLAADHPEWLITDGAGAPVDAGARHGPMYGLDVTHPGATEWLRETFRTVVEEWGIEYLKLDFLYAAALPGERHGDVTRAQAYRHGLATIREAVGDAFVLGCGAPGFPSVGLVDAMRVGPDTAPYWRREGDAASEPAHENAIRNVLNRQFCHRRLWLNDPDCQLVRTTTDLTDPERRSFAALVALTGGTNVLSDAVDEIDAAGRDLFERTLPPVDTGSVVGVGDTELPARVVCRRSADDAVAVAAFNWDDEAATVRVDPAEYLDADAVVAVDAFGDDGLHDGPIEREVPPHGVLLVHAAPASDEPRVVAAHHLANAATQLTHVECVGGSLVMTSAAEQPMNVTLAVPPSVTTSVGEQLTDRTVRVTVHPGETTIPFTER